MRVEWACFVRSVSGPAGTPTLHEVGFNRATVDRLPVEVPLLVVVRVVTPPDELGSDVAMSLEVADPRLVVRQRLKATAHVVEPANAIPGWEIRNWIPVHVRLEAVREGVYTLRVRVEDELAWELPSRVELARLARSRGSVGGLDDEVAVDVVTIERNGQVHDDECVTTSARDTVAWRRPHVCCGLEEAEVVALLVQEPVARHGRGRVVSSPDVSREGAGLAGEPRGARTRSQGNGGP